MKEFLEVLFFIYYCVAKKYGIYIEDTFFGNSLLPSPLNSLAKTENLRGIQQKTAVSSVIEILQFRHSVVILLPHR